MKQLALLLIMSLSLGLNAQKIQGGVFFGLSNYNGDLAYRNLEHTEAHLAYGIFGRYNLHEHVSLKSNLYVATVSGNDLNAGSITVRQRNLSFRSTIVEFGILPEINIHKFVLKSSHIVTPYIYTGVNLFYFNPKAFYDGQWVTLQPLGTEGQGLPGRPTKYNRIALAIPGGLGVKVQINAKTTLEFEMGMRYTFTDYLDDVSTTYPDLGLLEAVSGQLAVALSDRTSEYTGEPVDRKADSARGNPTYNDYYYFMGFSIAIYLDNPDKKKIKQ